MNKKPKPKLNILNYKTFLGFVWQVFCSRGGCRGSIFEKLQKLPLCPSEPKPAGSKSDLPLAKAECISETGSASRRTDLTKGKNYCAGPIAARERSENK